MGVFANNAITDVGRILLADVQAGAVFTPTRVVIGSGSMPSGKTAASMTAVVTPVKSLTINKKLRTPDGRFICGGVYTNEDITEAFYFRELALYAKAVYLNADGSVGSEGPETLYSYGNAGATADLMPAYGTNAVVERQIDLVTWVGNTATVNMTIESGLGGFIPITEKGQAGGVATLGADGLIPPEQMPPMDYVKKTGDTMSDSLIVDKGVAWAGFQANRTVSGQKHKATFAVGATGNAAVQTVDGNGQITSRAEFSPKGLEFDLAFRFAAQTDQNLLTSGTILDYAVACQVDTTKHISADYVPSDIPFASAGVLEIKVQGSRRHVLFRPYGGEYNGSIGPFARNINNGAWETNWVRVGPMVNGAILYVSANTGNDTTGNGTQAKPFKTLGKALAVIGTDLGGFTARINVEAGTYNENIILQGIANGTLNIVAVNTSNRPVFNGYIRVYACGPVTFIGLHLNGTVVNMTDIQETTFVKFDRCTIEAGTSTSSKNGIYVTEGAVVYVYSCTINNCGYAILSAYGATVAVSGCTGSGNTIAIMAQENGMVHEGNNNTIASNIKYSTGNGGRIFAGAQTSVPNY